MRDMHQLASLMLEFKRKTVSDVVAVTSHHLLNRKFYPYLAAAIQTLSARPEDEDSEEQLKQGLQHVMKTAAGVLKLKYIV